MGDKTGISWTDSTWNAIRGCRRVSKACQNCYAERMASRFCDEGQPYEGLAERTERGPRWTGRFMFIEDKLEQLMRWKRPRMVFVNSMSDLFWDEVPDEVIKKHFWAMIEANHHTYQVLTKRPERMAEFVNNEFPHLSEEPHIWLGTSIEDQETAEIRLPYLLRAPAAMRFLSIEPILGHVDLSQWLTYNPVYEQHKESRGEGLRSGKTERTGGRHSGADLEDWEARMGPLEPVHPDKQMQARKGGTYPTNRVSPGKSYAGQGTIQRVGPPVGLASLQREDTGQACDQSQERDQVRQQAEESRSSDTIRERQTRSSCSGRRDDAGPRRREEPNVEVDSCRRGGDQAKEGNRRKAVTDSRGFRGRIPDYIEDCPPGPLVDPARFWVIVGGESGPYFRKCQVEWVGDIVDACKDAGIPVFVKQDSNFRNGQQGRIPDELWIKEMPVNVRQTS